MKGIMILGFNKSPGAYIDTQYPDRISESLNVKTSDLMNIYALHRMRRMEPNYLQIKIKNVSVASFYTGFSFKHYVGKPDFAITVFLSDDDTLPKDFEGMVRRIANELLPKRGDLTFDDDFIDYYNLLAEGELEPYWAEFIEGEGSKIATIQAEELQSFNADIPTKTEHLEDLSFDDQFDTLEKEELKDEIKELQQLVNEKNEKLREFTKRITEQVSDTSEHAEEVQLLQTQLDEQNVKLDDWSLKLADLNEKNTILMETVRKLTEMSMQQTEEMERQGRKILELKKELKDKEEKIGEMDEGGAKVAEEKNQKIQEIKKNNFILKQEIEELNNENDKLQRETDKLKEENELHLDTIANLKMDIKELKDSISEDNGVHDQLADEIIDLKKELKVLRRERDHYKEIVKEKNLL